jgi:hypothetical protein
MPRTHARTCFLLATLALPSCLKADPALDYGDPTALSAPSTEAGIVAYIIEPKATAQLTAPSAPLLLAAYTTGTPRPLDVTVGTAAGAPRAAKASGSPGPGQRFAATVPLLHGTNLVSVAITTQDGKNFRKLDYALVYQGKAPGIDFKLLTPAADGGCDGATPIAHSVTAAEAVCVQGRVTTAGTAVKSIKVGTAGQQANPTDLLDGNTFLALVPLSAGEKQAVEATVQDATGAQSTARADIFQDNAPPELTLTAPGPGPTLRTDDDVITLEGEVSDDQGVAEVRVETASGGGQAASLDAPGQPESQPWKVDLKLVPGVNKLLLVARDVGGNVSKTPIEITSSRVHRLSAPKSNQGSTTLALDRTAMSALLKDDDQKKLKLATISLRPAVVAALGAIKEPEKHGVDTKLWGAPEHNMNTLLNMTPDTANLQGSSVQALLNIAGAVGLPPARVLAELLGLDVTSSFVALDIATDVIMEQLIGNHPNIDHDDKGQPAITVSLYDVFQDLHTIGQRFGPAGDHPGFLSGQTEAKVLEPGFRMQVPVRSNLEQYDGLDASADSKAALFVLGGDKVLELDFSSNAFSIVGLTDEPTVDLRMTLQENPEFLHAGDQKEANPDAQHAGFYRGNSPVWQAQPWQLERIVAEIGYRQNYGLYPSGNYKNTLKYDAGSIMNAAVVQWDRGWVEISTAGGIGMPPPPQYAWDILLEVAQIRLHDGGVAEGKADLAFALKGLSIGLTADELVASVKPQLQAQSGDLSKLIAGTSGLAGSTCDLFFAPQKPAQAPGFLFFRAAGDEGGTYAYAQPGFFADAGLTQKVSQAGPLPGTSDSTHEKLAATKGTKAFFRDNTAAVYQLEIIDADAGGASIRLTPVSKP